MIDKRRRMRFRRSNESQTNSFIGRLPSAFDERSYVVGYFSELARQHVLSDLFIEQVLGVIDDSAKVKLAVGLYELCGDVIDNETLKNDIDALITGGRRKHGIKSQVEMLKNG